MKENIRQLLESAERGDAQAQYELANKYYVAGYSDDFDGMDEDDCKEEAFKWFYKAAEQGHVDACFWLAHCIKCCVGIEFANPNGALPYALKAAEGGHVGAMEMLYELYSNDMFCDKWDFEEAIKWLKKAAESGNTSAKLRLGERYIKGFSFSDRKKYKFETNPAEGFKWLKAAADDGNTSALKRLADCYYEGVGIEKNIPAAVEIYLKSAQNDRNAQFKLGELYFKGEDVPKDYKKAIEFYEKASVSGHAGATKRLGDLYLNGRGVEKNSDKAVEYYDRAASQDDKGFFGVRAAIALMYAKEGPLRDERKAVINLKKSVNFVRDNAEVYYEIAKRHLVGSDFRDRNHTFECYVIRKDFEDAALYFKRAAELGHARAQYEYGKCFLNAIGVKADKAEAEKWFKKASEGGCEEAKDALNSLK